MAGRRMAVIICLLCLCLPWLPGYAQAASSTDASEPISPEKSCSLTLSCRCGEESVSDQMVRLYKIAHVSGEFQYTLTDPFKSSGLILNGIQSQGEWNVIRSTLESHITAQNIAPDFEAATDPEGLVCFEGLMPGLYLAVTEQAVRDGWTYVFDSALIALPGLGNDGLWQYQVAAAPKAEAIPPIEPDEKIELRVMKLWKGDAGRTDRPQRVEVEIFRDGVSYQRVTLSEENQWAYSWSSQDDGAVWTVTERNIPAGYTMTVSERETSFVITNTRKPDNPDAPQTGDTTNVMLYIVLMIVSGIMLILLGIAGKRKRP